MSHMVEHDLDPEELEQLEQEEDVFGQLCCPLGPD